MLYIAFSIHGTNCFITAVKNDRIENLDAKLFSVVRSRRPDFDSAKETKISYKPLNKGTGAPHTDPIWVIRRFNELAKMGWTINDQNFRKHHFG